MKKAKCVFVQMIVLAVMAGVAQAIPYVFITYTEGGSSYNLQYTSGWSNPSPGIYTKSSFLVDMVVSDLGRGFWRLDLEHVGNSGQVITEVRFPWEAFGMEWFAGGDIAGDMAYYPRIGGMVHSIEHIPGPYNWKGGLLYPHTQYAPFVIVADDKDGRIVSAVNWPPKHVLPRYSRGLVTLVYPEQDLHSGDTSSYEALIQEVEGDESKGIYPWQLAADKYIEWVRPLMIEEELYPFPHPDWLKQVPGMRMLSLVNLHNYPIVSPDIYDPEYHDPGIMAANITSQVEEDNWHLKTGLVMLWAQNTEYSVGAGVEGVGTAMHPRFVDAGLIDIIEGWENSGVHVGLYSRDTVEPLEHFSTNPVAQAVFLDWAVTTNMGVYGCSAFYGDTLGGSDHGPALDMARWLRDDCPPDGVLERSKDIYPSSGIMGATLGVVGGEPSNHLEQVKSGDIEMAAFPALSRYIEGNRVIFMGFAGTTLQFTQTAGSHWLDRQIWLLGVKPVVRRTTDVLSQDILDLREDLDWYSRDPIFMEKKGLYDVPSFTNDSVVTFGVNRFIDINGVNLFAVDNYLNRSGLEFSFYGKKLSVETSTLSLIELEGNDPLPGLVAHWTFNDGGGTSADDRVNGGTAACSGTVEWLAEGRGGASRISTGEVFSAGGLDAVSTNGTQYTVMGWIKPEDGVATRHLWNRNWPASMLCQIHNGSCYAYQSVDGNNQAMTLSSPITDNEWHHVAVTYRYDPGGSSNYLTLFIDGAEADSSSLSGAPDLPLPSSDFIMGGSNFGGCLDEFRVYDRELAAEEIATEATLLLHMPMDYVDKESAQSGFLFSITTSNSGGGVDTKNKLGDMSGREIFSRRLPTGCSLEPGRKSMGFRCDGDNDGLMIDGVDVFTNSYTIVAHVKASPNTDGNRYFYYRTADATCLFDATQSTVTAYQSVGASSNVAVVADFPHDNNFHHVAVVVEYDGLDTILDLYVDGILAASDSAPYPPAWSDPDAAFKVGEGSLNATRIDVIDELSIYNEALDADLVKFLADRRF